MAHRTAMRENVDACRSLLRSQIQRALSTPTTGSVQRVRWQQLWGVMAGLCVCVCVCVCAFQKLRCEQQVGANGRRQGAEPFLNPFYTNSNIRLSSERQGPSLLLPLRQPI
jgi:hypothetical protein